MRLLVSFFVLCFFAGVERAPAIEICGNYCGPNWCAGITIDEHDCVADHVWGTPAAAGSCVDECCKAHDYCCGSGSDRAVCNDAIVSCLGNNHCYRDSFCGLEVWAAMELIDDWCCGSPCPQSRMQEIELQLNMTVGAAPN